MSDRMPRRLPDDLADLLAIERDAPVPAEVEERLLARVHATVAVEPAPPAAAPEPPALPATTGISKAAVGLIAAALIGIGGVVYESHRADRDGAARPVPELAGSPGVTLARSRRWRTVPTEPAARPPAVSTAPAIGADTLAAERVVLDRAQEEILAGDGAAALAAVREHSDRFRRGVLVEEREALRVQALAIAGRAAEARERGERFLARYPRSIQRGAVRAALESLP